MNNEGTFTYICSECDEEWEDENLDLCPRCGCEDFSSSYNPTKEEMDKRSQFYAGEFAVNPKRSRETDDDQMLYFFDDWNEQSERELFNQLEASHHIYTVIDDGGDCFIISGCHRVNRMGYMFRKEPFKITGNILW